jgi:hexosaminidase
MVRGEVLMVRALSSSTLLVKVLLLLLLAGCAARETALPEAAPAGAAAREESALRYPIMPAPVALAPRDGELVLSSSSAIVIASGSSGASVPAAAAAPTDTAAQRIATLLADQLRAETGLPLPVRTGVAAQAGDIVLLVADAGDVWVGDALLAGASAALPVDEAYTLDVTRQRALLSATSPAGLFRGTQTLRQLVTRSVHAEAGASNGATARGTGSRDIGSRAEAAFVIPSVRIDDAPRFAYRGMHLDAARHFFPVDFVKRYIDLLALYRFNVFHWHLTEDQGWRIEILKYPRLTEVGAWRSETMVGRNFDPYIGDGERYGGYYTQDEIRDVVAYAAARHITIIPEIEMPGHSLAALAAYPELGCTPGPFEVATSWGVFDDILCPHEHTFEFLEDVLTEVMALFPSEYIHIGGDEAPKTRWESSDVAQDVIRREGLADEHELQSWFIQRIERFLNAHGRRLIGWDEILEGGLAPNATVMSWRGTAGGIAAARAGHDVVMTPTSHMYFDYYQGAPEQEPLAIGGFVPLEQVLAFEPVPAELTADEARHVLGAQGNVWTEYMRTTEHVEYMVLPRMLALAEVVWSPRERRDWHDFVARLPAQLERLDALAYNWRVPDVQLAARAGGTGGAAGGDLAGGASGVGAVSGGTSGSAVPVVLTLDSTVVLELSVPLRGAVIRYTTDGSEATTSSPAYVAPVAIRVPAEHAHDGTTGRVGGTAAGTPDDTATGTGRGTVVRARAFLPDGRMSAERAAVFRRATLRESAAVPASARVPGLDVEYVEGRFRRVADMDTVAVVRRAVAGGGVERGAGAVDTAGADAGTVVGLQGFERDEWFGLRFAGWIELPADGIWTFHLTSDDGAVLRIGADIAVDHDGLHGPTERSGQVALRAGLHPVEVHYFQAGGGRTLALEVTGPDGVRRPVPDGWWWRGR